MGASTSRCWNSKRAVRPAARSQTRLRMCTMGCNVFMPTKTRATGTPISFRRRAKPSTKSSSDRLRRPASASQSVMAASFNLLLCLDATAGAAAAFVDLVQLDHVAAGIVHEELCGIGTDEALDHPILHTEAIELGTGLHDVLHGIGNVRPRRILTRPLGHRRGLLAADQVDLADLADIDPGAGNAGDGRSAAVALQPEDVGVEILRGLQQVGVVVDANAGVMDFQDLDGHDSFPPMPVAAPSCPWAGPRSDRRS